MTADIQCQSCQMTINLIAVSQQSEKCCNWCGNRNFLLELTTQQASTLYNIDPKTLGKRIKDNANE